MVNHLRVLFCDDDLMCSTYFSTMPVVTECVNVLIFNTKHKLQWLHLFTHTMVQMNKSYIKPKEILYFINVPSLTLKAGDRVFPEHRRGRGHRSSGWKRRGRGLIDVDIIH